MTFRRRTWGEPLKLVDHTDGAQDGAAHARVPGR